MVFASIDSSRRLFNCERSNGLHKRIQIGISGQFAPTACQHSSVMSRTCIAQVVSGQTHQSIPDMFMGFGLLHKAAENAHVSWKLTSERIWSSLWQQQSSETQYMSVPASCCLVRNPGNVVHRAYVFGRAVGWQHQRHSGKLLRCNR